MRVNWRMAKEYQKLLLWTPTGDKDLGGEELERREQNEVWTSLRLRNAELLKLREYRPFTSQIEINWSDLPKQGVIAVSRVIPTKDRGTEFRLLDLNSVPRPRTVGLLVRVTWKLFTNEKEEFEDPVEVDIPNEITLAQLLLDFEGADASQF
jgi:hypothetical protein